MGCSEHTHQAALHRLNRLQCAHSLACIAYTQQAAVPTLQLTDAEGELAQEQLQQRPLVVQVACGCMHVVLPSLPLTGLAAGLRCLATCAPRIGCFLNEGLAFRQGSVLCQVVPLMRGQFIHLWRPGMATEVAVGRCKYVRATALPSGHAIKLQ